MIYKCWIGAILSNPHYPSNMLRVRNAIPICRVLHHRLAIPLKQNNYNRTTQVRTSYKLRKQGLNILQYDKVRRFPKPELADDPTAWKLYETWRKEHNVTHAFYKAYLHYCVKQSGPGKPEFIDKFLKVCKDMEEDGYPMDSESYTLLIQVYARSREIEKAFAAKEEMDKKGLEPFQSTFGALIRACCLVEPEQKERAKKVYEEMKQKEMCPYFLEFERLYKSLKQL